MRDIVANLLLIHDILTAGSQAIHSVYVVPHFIISFSNTSLMDCVAMFVSLLFSSITILKLNNFLLLQHTLNFAWLNYYTILTMV